MNCVINDTNSEYVKPPFSIIFSTWHGTVHESARHGIHGTISPLSIRCDKYSLKSWTQATQWPQVYTFGEKKTNIYSKINYNSFLLSN